MQNYTTQMDAARKGIVTPEMEIVAKKEYRTTEEIRQLVAEGKVAIPANKHHTCLNPEGIGSMPVSYTHLDVYKRQTVDIPEDWNPRAKQQPTGLIACSAAQSRPVQIPRPTK